MHTAVVPDYAKPSKVIRRLLVVPAAPAEDGFSLRYKTKHVARSLTDDAHSKRMAEIERHLERFRTSASSRWRASRLCFADHN